MPAADLTGGTNFASLKHSINMENILITSNLDLEAGYILCVHGGHLPGVQEQLHQVGGVIRDGRDCFSLSLTWEI